MHLRPFTDSVSVYSTVETPITTTASKGSLIFLRNEANKVSGDTVYGILEGVSLRKSFRVRFVGPGVHHHVSLGPEPTVRPRHHPSLGHQTKYRQKQPLYIQSN